ncbi:MAG: hypothetical protein Q4C96_05410 [Planctomycetia bacterium]|nr:hypothetical protein [Planctomycetia bacterium]
MKNLKPKYIKNFYITHKKTYFYVLFFILPVCFYAIFLSSDLYKKTVFAQEFSHSEDFKTENSKNSIKADLTEKVSLSELFKHLDSDRYSQRTAAQEKLYFLSQNPEFQPILDAAITEKLQHPGISYEVQHQLLRIRKNMPVKINPPLFKTDSQHPDTSETHFTEKKTVFLEVKPFSSEENTTKTEISVLLHNLTSNDYAIRTFSQRRLLFLANKPAFTWEILEGLRKIILSHLEIADDELRILEMENQVRFIWLSQEEMPENTPIISTERMMEWIQEIAPLENSSRKEISGKENLVKKNFDSEISFFSSAANEINKRNDFSSEYSDVILLEPGELLRKIPIPSDFHHAQDSVDKKQRLKRWLALRYLSDMMACKKYVKEVDAQLFSRYQKNISALGQENIASLRAFLMPLIASEFWVGGKLQSSQILEPGIPQKNDMMIRPTHFDTLKENSVRCVSGNNLSPGTHPLHTAIPHPKRKDAFFHLVNLSSVRLQLMYPTISEQNMSQRWSHIVHRTLTPKLAKKRPLSMPEFIMLDSLPPAEIGVLATAFLNQVKDVSMYPNQYMPASFNFFYQKETTHHTLLCVLLGEYGTDQAIPELLKAIKAGKTPSGSSLQQPYAMGHIAAFRIALRTHWDGMDAWLISLLENTSPLVFASSPQPDPMLVSLPIHTHPTELNGEPDLSQNTTATPQIGATAAAIWMKRHNIRPENIGLIPSSDVFLLKCGIQGYYYKETDTVKEIKRLIKVREMAL